MTNDPTPMDPTGDPAFERELAERMDAAAATATGAGVSLDGVLAAAGSRGRRTRRRRTLAAVAATVLLVGGGVALASASSDRGEQEVRTADDGTAAADPTTTTTCVVGPPVTTAVAPIVTSSTTTQPGDPTPFEVWVEVLRDAGLLTPEQEAEAAAGRGFELTGEQSAVLEEHWAAQELPITTTTVVGPTSDGVVLLTQEQVELLVAEARADEAFAEQALGGAMVSLTLDQSLALARSEWPLTGEQLFTLGYDELAGSGWSSCTETTEATDASDPGPTTSTTSEVGTAEPTTTAPATTSTTEEQPVPTTSVVDDPCAEPTVAEGTTVLLRQAGDQPEGTVDLLQLTEAQAASLADAGLIGAEQLQYVDRGAFFWVSPEQHAHLLANEAELGFPVAFGYAAYPDRSGGQEVLVVELDPSCLVPPGE
jgi:cell division septation protein DedD